MNMQELQARARSNEALARYTTSRIGGPADLLIEARNADELLGLMRRADELNMSTLVLGAGANVLVSDRGVRGLVILNRGKEIKFSITNTAARVEVDSGVALVTLARDCIERGLSGFEWAIGVPGTVGGAVVGNAGAHGADVKSNLYLARVARHGGEPEYWSPRQLALEYRSSALKRYAPAERPMVLGAIFNLKRDNRTNLEQRASNFNTKRRATQPPGATIGSMFKNPPGDFAGRLIEAAGLKEYRIGGAMISPIHANFFMNMGAATATDVYALTEHARNTVYKQFEVMLELEVELLGDWDLAQNRAVIE